MAQPAQPAPAPAVSPLSEAVMYARYALMMFIVAFLIYMLWGVVDMAAYRDFVLGGIMMGFAIMALISYGFVRPRAYDPLASGDVATAYQHHVACLILGFIFGFGLAGVFLVLAYSRAGVFAMAAAARPPAAPAQAPAQAPTGQAGA